MTVEADDAPTGVTDAASPGSAATGGATGDGTAGPDTPDGRQGQGRTGGSRFRASPLRTSQERRKLRARRVDRVIRRADPWSVMKLAFLFQLSLYVIFMLAGTILWSAAVRTGAIDNVESFITELFGLESFEFNGGQLFRGSAVGGLIMVLVGTGFSVLLAVLFNLISDLIGGVRVSVIELENLRRGADGGTSGRDQASGAEPARRRRRGA